VSTVVTGDAGTAGQGPAEPTTGPRPALPAGSRTDPRLGTQGERLAGGQARRSERVSAAAGQRDHGRDVRRARLEPERGPGSLSPGPLHVHQTHGPVCDV